VKPGRVVQVVCKVTEGIRTLGNVISGLLNQEGNSTIQECTNTCTMLQYKVFTVTTFLVGHPHGVYINYVCIGPHTSKLNCVKKSA
jgi:hypothetical protein